MREHNTCSGAELILRNQTAGQKQRITIKTNLRPGNGFPVFVHPGYDNSLQPLPAQNVCNSMAQIKRNLIILEALYNVPVETGRIRHDFDTGKDFGALQRHSSGHNQPDIAGTKDDYTLSGHHPFKVDIFLSGSG